MTKAGEGNTDWVGNQERATGAMQTFEEDGISACGNKALPTSLALSLGLGKQNSLQLGAPSTTGQALHTGGHVARRVCGL